MCFIGDNVPENLNNKSYEHGNVQMLISRGLYHEIELDTAFADPDLVIGMDIL